MAFKGTKALFRQLTQQSDLSSFEGPCDFVEQDFNERVSATDYVKISILLSSLPMAVAIISTIDQVKFRIHQFCKDSKYQKARRGIVDSMMDAAMDYVARNTNWTQLRIITPLRPLRIELKHAKYEGLNNYNYYFGGENFSARWLHETPDRTRDDPVVYYMHGGSYAIKTQKLQLDYMYQLTKKLMKHRVSVLVLDYTIGSYRKHPAQLHEGLACYHQLKQSCDNIIAFGDSCGGHLALAMLLADSSVTYEGLMMISPSTDLTGNSYDERTMRECFVDLETTDVNDPILSPVKAGTETWTKLLPENTAMVWGSEEECAKSMEEWVEVAKISKHYEEIGGGHDCILRGPTNKGSQFVEMHMLMWVGGEDALSETRKRSSTISLNVLTSTLKSALKPVNDSSNSESSSTTSSETVGSEPSSHTSFSSKKRRKERKNSLRK